MIVKVTPKETVRGLFSVPGDKSISHRAVMLGALAEGDTQIRGFLAGEDCLSTINCFKSLGVDISTEKMDSGDLVVTIHGKGLYGLRKPENPLYVGNSGTTIRLISGIVAAQPFETLITGDSSITSRPMKRIIDPLTLMGAKITSNEGNAPLLIQGNPNLKAISYTSPISSAQVKSCMLLAGLYAEGETTVSEPAKSRNHTELMLKYFNADITIKDKKAAIRGKSPLAAQPVYICGDISSAAFLIVGALITDNSEIIITNVGVNPTRIGIITVLREMGADIEVLHRRIMCGEYVADIKVKSSRLKGIEIAGEIIPTLIDEIPILTIAALFAEGKTIIRDASELKVKESNRIDALACELSKMGASLEGTEDGLKIEGGKPLVGTTLDSRKDHRLAMSFAIAALKAKGETQIIDGECVNVSFPEFFEILEHFK